MWMSSKHSKLEMCLSSLQSSDILEERFIHHHYLNITRHIGFMCLFQYVTLLCDVQDQPLVSIGKGTGQMKTFFSPHAIYILRYQIQLICKMLHILDSS